LHHRIRGSKPTGCGKNKLTATPAGARESTKQETAKQQLLSAHGQKQAHLENKLV